MLSYVLWLLCTLEFITVAQQEINFQQSFHLWGSLAQTGICFFKSLRSGDDAWWSGLIYLMNNTRWQPDATAYQTLPVWETKVLAVPGATSAQACNVGLSPSCCSHSTVCDLPASSGSIQLQWVLVTFHALFNKEGQNIQYILMIVFAWRIPEFNLTALEIDQLKAVAET